MNVDELNWEEVSSSNISQIAYDEAEETIYVEFTGGAVWSYGECPKQLYERFRVAPSIGRFFQSEIKDTKPAEQVA